MSEVTLEEAARLSRKLNIDSSVVPDHVFAHEINMELSEHRDVLGNNPEKAARIALAHLKENPRYPQMMEELEEKAREYWAVHPKPSVVKGGSAPSVAPLLLAALLVALVLAVAMLGYTLSEKLFFPERNILRRSRAPWMDARGYPRGGLGDFYFSTDSSLGVGDSFDNCFNNPACAKIGLIG